MEQKCPMCGAPLTDGTCEYCGYKTGFQANAGAQESVPYSWIDPVAAREASRKSKLAALLIWFFFGVFGGHRFYVGKYGTGFLYLFTAGLFLIGWFVDLILILTGSFKDQYGFSLR